MMRNTKPPLHNHLDNKLTYLHARPHPSLHPSALVYDAAILGQQLWDVTVTKLDSVVDDFLAAVKRRHPGGRLIVGFDTELISVADQLGTSIVAVIATINLCVGRRVLIFHLPSAPYNVLGQFFRDENNLFVGVDIRSKLERLKDAYGIGDRARYLDLGERAAEKYEKQGLRTAGLKEIAEVVLGKEVWQPDLTGEWEIEPLSDDYVVFACVDAFVPVEIANVLLKDEIAT